MIIKRIFYILNIGIVFCNNAMAKKCDSGSFYMTGYCYYCRPGCFCEYPGNVDREKLDPNDKISISKNDDSGDFNMWCAHKRTECSNQGNNGYGEYTSKIYEGQTAGRQCGKSDAAKVYRCPDSFPKSNASATSVEECYVQCTPPGGEQQLKYKKIHLGVGEMLNYRTEKPVSCTSASAHLLTNQICPGGDFYPSCSENRGVKTCDEGTTPNAERTKCIEIVKNEEEEQTQTNKETKIHCESGEYLKADTEKCVECSGSAKYCPGGDFNKSSKDQGIFNCPNGGRANKDKSACTITFTKKQMQECWIYSGDSDMYKECLFKNNKTTNEQNIKKDTLILKNINTELLKKDLKIPKQNIKINSNLNNSVLKNKL